jgi:hypothetical protein
LTAEGYPADRIAKVVSCIDATSMPQHPRNLLEQILCDADLCHLASSSYPDYQEMLRVEWHLELGLSITDEEWNVSNDKFLKITPTSRRTGSVFWSPASRTRKCWYRRR